MEGKHITSDHYRHEHHNSAGTEEIDHRKESHGGWACNKCGWTHPNQHPSAKQRRNHKKHCGKIEGFKLINSGDTEKRGPSSEEVSSDEEHKSTDHTEKEGKDITSHQHQLEQPIHPTEENHHTKQRHGWVCHRCGWTYPNPHPSAKHRKNHKMHCGKIEGFKLIHSEDKDIQGGSSDDESSDDELKSTDHEKLSSVNENNLATQKNASPSTSDYTSSNLGISSNEYNVGAIQTLCISDNGTLKPPKTTGIAPGIDANAGNSIVFGESGEETLVESTTAGIGMHGLNVNGTVKPSKNLIGPDIVLSEDKSNLFYKVIPDTDNNQYSSGSVERQEFPVNSHQLQNPSQIQAPRTFGKSAPTPVHAVKEHNMGIGSRRIGIASILSFNGLNSGDLNPKVASVEDTSSSADTKIHELSHTNHQAYESQTQEVLVSETKEDEMQPSDLNEGLNIKLPLGTESQKDYPPSLAFEPETQKLLQSTSNKPENYTSSKSTSPSASTDLYSSREADKPSNFSNTNSQDTLNFESDNKTTTRVPSGLPELKAGEEREYPHSESVEKIPVDQQSSSEVIIAEQERSADGSSTTLSKAGEWKEAESCRFMDSSTIKHDMKISDPNCKKEDSALASEVIDSENSAKSEICRSEYAIISDEKKNSAEHDMFLRPGDYIESKNISCMHEDADKYREEENSPNFENSKSDDMMHPEEEKVKIINLETMKGSSSEGIESNSGQEIDEQAKNVIIPYQETSSTDSFATEYSKECEQQKTECSSFTRSSTSQHDMKDYNPESRMADSTLESIIVPATDIVRDADTPVNEVANENQEAIKGPSSEAIESTSGQKLDEKASNVVILDQETSGTDSFQTEYSKEGEKKQIECSSITSFGTIEHDMKNYNPDCRMTNSMPENIVMPAPDIVRDADTPLSEEANENQVAVKGLSSECIESTSGLKIDEQASNVVIPDQETSGTGSFLTAYSREGEKLRTECSSVTSFGIIEHDMKDYNPDSRMADSTPEFIVMPGTNIVRDADTPVSELANENQEAVTGPPFEGIEFTSGQKLDEQASNVVIPHQETSGTDSFPTEYSKEGEKKQIECSSITSSSTIEHDMKDYNPDCRTTDSTSENIVMPATNIVRDADTPVNEVANENHKVIKGPLSEHIEFTSGQKLDEQASNVVIPHQESSGTDSFPTEYSKEDEKKQTECCSITSFSTIEHDYCRMADSTPENIVMPATDIVKDADTAINEVANEKSAAAESHYPESMVYNHEQKNTIEKAISVNPAEYIESKEIHNLEKANVMKEPCSGGIETTSDQKLISKASSKLVITDKEMIKADNPPIEYSGLGESQQNECNTPTNSSLIEPCVRDGNPDSKNDYSIQGNIMQRDLDRDGHIDAYIHTQESLSEAAAIEIVHANSAASESVQSNANNTYSSSQDVACANFGVQLAEEELQYKQQGLEHSGVEQSDHFKVHNVNYTSCSTTTTVADNSLQLNASSTDGHDDSLKESMDDVHGSKTESLKTCEPALWEQLLESNAKELNNPEIYQDLGNAEQSPENPFTYGHNFSLKEEAHQTFHIEGGHGQILEEQKRNSADLEAPADMFEAPSFMTLVETCNNSEIWPSHREIQPNADLASGGSQNGELSAAAEESESERLERPHTPLRNLLAEENKRGTQDRSKQNPPLVEQPKTSSQNNIQGVHASTVQQGAMSSLNLEIAQKDSNSSSKKIMEKVWNSPARLPSPKVEKQKVKVKSAWSMCLCGSATN